MAASSIDGSALLHSTCFQFLQRFFRVSSKRPVRKDLQIFLVMRDRFTGVSGLIETLGQMELREGVVGLVHECLFIPLQCSAIVLFLEVEIANLDVFSCFVRIPGMQLLHVGGGVFGIGNRSSAHGMVFLVVGGRTEVNASVLAGTHLGGTGARLRLVLLGFILRTNRYGKGERSHRYSDYCEPISHSTIL